MADKVFDIEAEIGIDLNPLNKPLQEAGLKMDSFAKKFDDLDKILKKTEKGFDKQGEYLKKYGDDIEKVAERMRSSIEGKMHRALINSGQSIEEFMKSTESIDYSGQTKQIDNMLETIKKVREETEKLNEMEVGRSSNVGGVDATLVSSPSDRNILSIYGRKAKEAEEEYFRETYENRARQREIEKEFHEIEMRSISEIQTKYSEKFQGISNGFEKASNMASGFLKMMAAPIAAGVLSTKTWVDFNEGMVGVQKTADLTKEEMMGLSDVFREIALEEPVKLQDLTSIAQVGGRMNLDTDELEKYTETVSRMSIAFDDIAPGQAAEQVSQFMRITGTGIDDMESLGSTITFLGNNFETTEGKILQTALRLASTGEIVGMSEADTLGLAAAISGLGISSEMGGSAVSRTMQSMDSAVLSGSEELRNFARVAGMTIDEFTTAWADEPQEVLMQFTQGLNTLSEEGQDVYTIMADMGISNRREVDTLLRLSVAQDEMRRAIEGANQAYADGTALQEEYETAKDSDWARYVALQNRLVDIRLELGKNLMPVVEGFIDKLDVFVKFLDKVDDTKLQKFGQDLAVFLANAVIFAGFLAPIASGISKIFGTLSKVMASSFVTKLLAGEGLMAALGKFGTAISKIGGALSSLWGIVVAGVNMIMPYIGYIIAAIGALYLSIKEFRVIFESLQETKVGQVILAVFEGIAGGIAGVLDWLENGIDKAHEMVANGIDSLMELFGFEPPWPDFGKSIADVLEAMATPLGEWKLAIERLFDIEISWRDIFGGLLGALEFVEDTIDGWIVGIANKFSFKVPDIISDRGSLSDLIGWNAEGGVFSKPTIFSTPRAGLQGVGEAGPEAIIPLNRGVLGDIGAGIASTMRPDNGRTESLLAATLAEMKGMRKEITNMKVEMDGRAVGGVVTPYVNNNLGREKKFNNNRFR